ncbi:MAG: HAMP domain-containing histidine kinase [Lachnospiraceae bacterium]|nr:HAMP domain-containing histidine kinase [Lachnospiraceae bacterium]
MKKNKKIRAFIYRLIMVSSFITMIASGIFGREALVNLAKEGTGTFTGDVYYLTEMRELMADLFQNYMIAHVGIADDTGYPLTDENAERYELECHENFNNIMKTTGTKVLYQYQILHPNDENRVTSQQGNIDFPLYSENDGHLLETDNFRMTVYWDGPLEQLRFFDKVYSVPSPDKEYLTLTNYSPIWKEASEVRFIMGYNESQVYNYSTYIDMIALAEGYRRVLILFFASAAIFLISGIFSLFSGRKFAIARSEYGAFCKKITLEIKLLPSALAVFLWLTLDLNYTFATLEYRLMLYPALWLYYPLGMLLYLLWLDIRTNRMSFLTGSIIYKIGSALKNWNTTIPWKRKMQRICLVLVFGIIVNCLLLLDMLYHATLTRPTWTLFIILCILLLCQCFALPKLYHFLQDTDIVFHKLHQLSQGEKTNDKQLSKRTLLAASALAVNDLESGIAKAVEQENKANRMRVELITNVSHDLKTPLTSIINYADLLSEEHLAPPAGEYVEALRSKAYRLKKMVQDVFELSKATTGNLPVENNKLDLAKLVKQTLADMDEELQKSTLQFKLKISNEPLFIMADGEKMYRVFQNLLVNAMQYSLPGSRVHILLEAQNGYAIAKMKNVSLEEMNFNPEEIVERFVRADSSRTKEGSGLGLSIVQSFTQACGGEFSVDIDADLFTATIRFPLISDEEGITDVQTTEEI